MHLQELQVHKSQLEAMKLTAIIEGSLEAKLPTIWTDGKAEVERVREEKRREERRPEKRKSQKKEDAGAGKGRKVAKHCVFPMICGSGGSKSRLAKAAGAEPSGEMRDEKLHAVVARSTFASEKAKNISRSEHFWKLLLEVEMFKKCFAVVARSTFRSQHLQSTSASEHFWKFGCRRGAPLWREAHFEDIRSQNAKNTTRHFWTLKRRFVWQAKGILHPAKVSKT